MESELEALEQQLRSANGVPPAEKLIAYLRLVRSLYQFIVLYAARICQACNLYCNPPWVHAIFAMA